MAGMDNMVLKILNKFSVIINMSLNLIIHIFFENNSSNKINLTDLLFFLIFLLDFPLLDFVAEISTCKASAKFE